MHFCFIDCKWKSLEEQSRFTRADTNFLSLILFKMSKRERYRTYYSGDESVWTGWHNQIVFYEGGAEAYALGRWFVVKESWDSYAVSLLAVTSVPAHRVKISHRKSFSCYYREQNRNISEISEDNRTTMTRWGSHIWRTIRKIALMRLYKKRNE